MPATAKSAKPVQQQRSNEMKSRYTRSAKKGVSRGVVYKKKKMRNPDSTLPYNHYAKHTSLKRRLFQHREEQWEALATAPASGEMAALIRAMEEVYTKLHEAMRGKQYWKVRRLRHGIRYRRAKLRQMLLQISLDNDDGGIVTPTETAGEEKNETVAVSGHDSTPQCAKPKESQHALEKAVFCSFYPETVLLSRLAAQSHLETTAESRALERIDRRSGRYARKLEAAELQECVACAERSELDVIDEPERGAAEKLTTPVSLSLAPYCRNVMTDRLDDIAFTFLQALYAEQRDLKKKKPLQFSSRMKYVCGLQETLKFLRSGRLKMVLLASDIETPPPATEHNDGSPTQTKQGRRRYQTPLEAVETIVSLCDGAPSPTGNVSHIPCLTCLSRRRLAYALFAKGSHVACVGVLGTDRHVETFRALRVYGGVCLSHFATLSPAQLPT